MTSIASKIQSVDALRFDAIPVKPIKVARVVKTGRTTVFVSENGRIYSTGVANRVHYSFGSQSIGIDETFACCVKLGLLSKAAVDEHKRQVIEYRKRRTDEYAAEQLLENAKELGIKLTASQIRRANAKINAEKPKG